MTDRLSARGQRLRDRAAATRRAGQQQSLLILPSMARDDHSNASAPPPELGAPALVGTDRAFLRRASATKCRGLEPKRRKSFNERHDDRRHRPTPASAKPPFLLMPARIVIVARDEPRAGDDAQAQRRRPAPPSPAAADLSWPKHARSNDDRRHEPRIDVLINNAAPFPIGGYARGPQLRSPSTMAYFG
jgi:hypothetical protein